VKILALTWKHPLDATAGGAERYLLEVCRRWAKADHEVAIFGPRGPVASEGRESSQLGGLRYIGEGSRLTVFRAARRYLHANGHLYDRVLETVSTRPFAAHRVVGDKAVALYHQTAEEVWNLEFPLPAAMLGRYLLEPWWVRRMRGAHIVANSPSTRAALQRFGVQSHAVVPPGCDPPATLDPRLAPSPRPRLLWIGRMVRTKHPEDAISAHALVRQQIPTTTLDMVGAGYLQRELAGRRVPGVTIHGAVSDLRKRSLLELADLLLLPGTREGWGIVAMEAASYGVPVVAYDIPGLRDAVRHERTGMLVPTTSDALAAASIALLNDVGRWRTLSTCAQARARAFTWDRTARDLLYVLQYSQTHSGVSYQAPPRSLTICHARAEATTG
jgi:glycosyltransferase involved in cell wall biosynthesis